MPLQPFNIWFTRQQGHEDHKGCLFAGAIPLSKGLHGGLIEISRHGGP